jgi:hypothetical protein
MSTAASGMATAVIAAASRKSARAPASPCSARKARQLDFGRIAGTPVRPS